MGSHVCTRCTSGDYSNMCRAADGMGAAEAEAPLPIPADSTPLSVLPAAPGAVVPPAYTTKATGSTFLYRTGNVSAGVAQTQCNQWGGHLATYVRWEQPGAVAGRAERPATITVLRSF
jgi:hypothetical protein